MYVRVPLPLAAFSYLLDGCLSMTLCLLSLTGLMSAYMCILFVFMFPLLVASSYLLNGLCTPLYLVAFSYWLGERLCLSSWLFPLTYLLNALVYVPLLLVSFSYWLAR